MPYGYCETTSYIECASTQAVVDRIVELCAAEGMQRIVRPPFSPCDELSLTTNVWGVVIYPGVGGWSIVKSIPFDLMSDRAAGAVRSRFAQLCAATAARGFQLSIHDGPPAWGQVVLEVDAGGREAGSGWWHREDENGPQDIMHFYGCRLVERTDEPSIGMPDISKLFEESKDPSICSCLGDSSFEIFCQYAMQRLGGREEGAPVYDALRRGPPVACEGGVAIHFQWPAGDRPWPKPTEDERIAKELFDRPQFFYGDGAPVELGDAVLLGSQCTPAQVADFIAVEDNQGTSFGTISSKENDAQRELRPSEVVVQDGLFKKSCIATEHVRTELKLVERSSANFVHAGMKDIEVRAAASDADAQYALGYHRTNGNFWRQDRQLAAVSLRQSAAQNHRDAQFMLGQYCLYGFIAPQDFQEAHYWWNKAAANGHAGAQYALGLHYERGEGVEQDYERAVHWYVQSAEQGFPKAQCNLGDKFERGLGVAQDFKQAMHWYRRSADQGTHEAMFAIGKLYREGLGVPVDNRIAAQYWHRCGMEGFTDAMFELGRLYELGGVGVIQDLKSAKAWYSSAVKQGHVRAQERLRELGGE